MTFVVVVISTISEEGRPTGKEGMPALRLRRYTSRALDVALDLYYPHDCTLKQVVEYIEDYRLHGERVDEDEPETA